MKTFPGITSIFVVQPEKYFLPISPQEICIHVRVIIL